MLNIGNNTNGVVDGQHNSINDKKVIPTYSNCYRTPILNMSPINSEQQGNHKIINAARKFHSQPMEETREHLRTRS